CILLQFPPWFTVSDAHEAYLDFCCARLPDDRLAIEFRHASWFDGRATRTLELLAARRLTLVCVDAPEAPSIPRTPFTATSDIAYVRLHGRNRQAWFRNRGSAAERFRYLYSDGELRECATRIQQLNDAHAVHVVFNNCYGDYGIRNATTMRRL